MGAALFAATIWSTLGFLLGLIGNIPGEIATIGFGILYNICLGVDKILRTIKESR
jgi:hypothetical protein